MNGAKVHYLGPPRASDEELDGIEYSRLLRDPPPREWMVEGCFMRGTVGLISGNGGVGKCLGAGTPILMYDGSTRPVDEIKNGDLLMGPDSMPRLVRGTTSGVGPLFRVTPVKGDAYVVNANHVLSLKLWSKSRQRQFDFPVNLSVRRYLALPKEQARALMGWRSGVDWPSRPLNIAPYLMGLWLGDGTAGFPDITSMDGEATVLPAMAEFADGTDLYIREFHREDQGLASTYRLRGPGGRNNPNPFVEALRAYGIYTDKQIPADYLANSEQSRLELLAGLIDTDGHLIQGCYEITQKRQKLSEQIAFLARSLGFAAYVKVTMKKSQVSELRPYYRVHISGDISRVPVRLKHKKAAKRQQKKRVLVTSIKVEPIGEGPYYGFEVDGDHLFLLGDFTVTHNSLIMQQLATCAVLGRPWLGMHVQPGKALMLACEDDADELHRRQDAINRSLGRHMEDVLEAGLDLIPRVTRDNTLMSIDRDRSSQTYWRMKPEPLWHKLVTRCRRTGIQYVIIDTTAKTFGGNQNDARHVGDFVSAAQMLAILLNGVVLFTQHPSMYGRRSGTGESGSVQWENSVRARLYLHDHKTQGLILQGMKSNYSGKPKPIPLKWSRGVFTVREPEVPRDHTESGSLFNS